MSNFRLFHDLDSRDFAGITSTPAAVSTLPIGNLLLPTRARRTRWLDTSVTLTWHWVGGRIIDSIAAIRGNWSSSATWQVRLFADAERTELLFDSGEHPVYPRLAWGDIVWGFDPIGRSVYDGWPLKFGVFQFSPVLAAAGELIFTDPDNTDGFIDMSRLIVGQSWSPSHNADSISVAWLDDAKQTRTSGGSLVTVSAIEPYRSAELGYSSLIDSDRAAFSELARRLGGREDCFILCWDGATSTALLRDGALHAKFVTPPKAIHRARDAFDIPSFVLQEC